MENDGHDETGSAGGHPNAGWDANQCELVEIDPATNSVSVYRLDFRSGCALGAPWVIEPSKGTTAFRYTHAGMAARSKPPLVLDGAEVAVIEESVTANGASFSVKAARVAPDASGLEDDIVISYRAVVALAEAPDAAVYDARFMSDYYKAEVNRAEVFERPLFGAGLAEDTSYVLRVFAANPFGKETLVGEAAFRTAARVTPALGNPLLSVDFSTGSHADAALAPHNAVPTGTLTYESDSFGVPVAVFDGSSAVGYDFTADDYAAIAQAETIEVLFQFTANPTSGYFDLFSSAQGAGQDLSYYAPQLQHYVNTGSGYRCTEATVPLNAWTHVLATYDGVIMSYYLNGELVSTLDNPGSIPAPTASATRWFVGADVNSNGEMEKPMTGKVAFAKLTPGVATAAQAAELYVAAAPVAAAVAPPSADAIGTATAGEVYAIPPLPFADANGRELQGIRPGTRSLARPGADARPGAGTRSRTRADARSCAGALPRSRRLRARSRHVYANAASEEAGPDGRPRRHRWHRRRRRRHRRSRHLRGPQPHQRRVERGRVAPPHGAATAHGLAGTQTSQTRASLAAPIICSAFCDSTRVRLALRPAPRVDSSNAQRSTR